MISVEEAVSEGGPRQVCLYIVPDVSAEYNKQSLWSFPNLLNLIAFQKILSGIKFSYWVTNMWDW